MNNTLNSQLLTFDRQFQASKAKLEQKYHQEFLQKKKKLESELAKLNKELGKLAKTSTHDQAEASPASSKDKKPTFKLNTDQKKKIQELMSKKLQASS